MLLWTLPYFIVQDTMCSYFTAQSVKIYAINEIYFNFSDVKCKNMGLNYIWLSETTVIYVMQISKYVTKNDQFLKLI